MVAAPSVIKAEAARGLILSRSETIATCCQVIFHQIQDTCCCGGQARSQLLAAAEEAGLAPGTVEVLFNGVESGRVEAVLRAVPAGQVHKNA